MAITIGSNITSLRAQRSLGQSSTSLAKTFERLSSGQRINHASDDAAGLAIVSSLNADRRVYSQGVRNLNDGVSALNVAEGAIDSLSGIVIRLEELAEQSANGVYSAKQRKSLDAEAQALSDEYFRISKSTEFNGINLLDGTMDEIRLQAGYGTDGGIASGIGGAIGDGTFGSRTSFALGNGTRQLISGDFNNDGFRDLAAQNYNEHVVSLMLGNGDGTFKQRQTSATGVFPYTLVADDFNGDGSLDLVTGTINSHTIEVFLGYGDGTFLDRISLDTGYGVANLAAGDLNGDSIVDLVNASGQTRDEASVYIGTGDGTFRSHGSFALGDDPAWITAADLNRDGILDIVSADDPDDAISVLIGLGDGSFAARTSYASGDRPQSVTAADLNADGMLDLVAADATDGVASLFLGCGDGSFQERRSFAIGALPFSITARDFNGDGVQDLAAVNGINNSVSILKGNGDGTFSGRVSYFTEAVPRSALAVDDFNGDGVLDLAAGAYAAYGTVGIMLGNSTSGVAPLLPFDLTTMAGARQALPVFQTKLNQLSSQKGEIGAFQARLGVATSVLGSSVENMAAASGRIMDADVAEEAANLTRTQILQQAGASVLSQANQQPALALQLLRG